MSIMSIMSEYFTIFINIFMSMGYIGIIFLMIVESSFIPFPSELVMIPAGYLAYKNEMNFALVILCGTVGAYFGSVINYLIGKYAGIAFLKKYGKYFLLSETKVNKLSNQFNEVGEVLVFTGRLIPGVRQYVSIFAGMAKMNFFRFSLYSTSGIFIWIVIITYLGYVIGDNIELIQQYLFIISIIISILILLVLLIYFLYRKYKSLIISLVIIINTMFCIGYVKKMPGTIASLITVMINYLILSCLVQNVKLNPLILLSCGLIALTLVTSVAIKLTNIYCHYFKTHDPKEIVIDEFVGQSLSSLLTVTSYIIATQYLFKYDFLIKNIMLNYSINLIMSVLLIMSFVTFRIFDIIKIGWVKKFDQKYQSGIGIMMDDVVAGIYSWITIISLFILANLVDIIA